MSRNLASLSTDWAIVSFLFMVGFGSEWAGASCALLVTVTLQHREFVRLWRALGVQESWSELSETRYEKQNCVHYTGVSLLLVVFYRMMVGYQNKKVRMNVYPAGPPWRVVTITKYQLLPSHSEKQMCLEHFFIPHGDCRGPFDAIIYVGVCSTRQSFSE
jgi:hypothetical protein